VMLMANRIPRGRKSSTKRWTAAAPTSRMRRRMASITPAITRNDDHTRPWKSRSPSSDRVEKANVGKPKTTGRYQSGRSASGAK
jgi:hypothetical protein